MIIFIILSIVCNAEAILNLPEGSECFINGHKGKCVGAKSCESFNIVDLENRGLFSSEICSHNNIEVVVCCLDCEPFTRDYRDSAITGDGYIWKNGRKSWDKCVENLGKNVFNCIKYRKLQNQKIYDKEKKCFTTDRWSTGASWIYWLYNKPNSVSHIVFLEYGIQTFPDDKTDDKSNDSSSEVTESDVKELDVVDITGTEYCAGSIISERFILTAAQCGHNAENVSADGYTGKGGPKKKWIDCVKEDMNVNSELMNDRDEWKKKNTQTLLIMGMMIYDFINTSSSEPVTYAVVLNWKGNGKGHENSMWYEVKRFIPHPEYKSTVAAYHDIALIETKTEIVFSYTTTPICLLDDPSLSEENGSIMSWASENKDTGEKKKVKFDKVSRYNSARCAFRFSEVLTEGINATLHSCYVDPDDKSTCENVPGLPLEITKPLLTCARFLGGVALTNRTCGEADSIRLYTRVQPYIPWIEGIVWPDV